MNTAMRIRYGIAAAVFALAMSASALAGGEDRALAVGSKVGKVSMTDTRGTTHNLEDFKGKIVVIEWVNPHCPVSERTYEEKLVQPLQKTYTGKGVVWILINSTNPDHKDYESAESNEKMYKDWEASPTAICLDSDGKLGRLFQAKTTPHMFIIDQQQTLAYAGALDDDPRGGKTDKVSYVSKALDELLAGSAVTVSTTQPYGCSVKYKK
jgi:hypothetical protein